jgi:aspartate ammonia-lyase
MRVEKDLLGEMEIPEEAYWGIHTARSVLGMSVSGCRVSLPLVRAMAVVKSAAARVNAELGFLPPSHADAIVQACDEVTSGFLDAEFRVDALQGGAGTSTHMNVNEVVAARASEILGGTRGDRALVSPLEHVNMHQSTNDVYPTALRLAAIHLLRDVASSVASLQGALQRKEKEFARIVKVGRTELQEAVPMTLGQEFGGYAEAIARDRWRTFKCEERLRVVNLGGTAIGTGLTAPRDYIFRVVDKLRDLTAVGFARGENLTGETAHSDALVEVSGILKALAANLVKISGDLRMLNMLGEITLPAVQAGSSIMPGKVNPVVCEMVAQVGLKVMANDFLIADCASRGSFQINEFLPLIAHSLLESLELLKRGCDAFSGMVSGITGNAETCQRYLQRSDAIITVLVPVLGYERCSSLVVEYRKSATSAPLSLYQFLCEKLGVSVVDDACRPESVLMLGHRMKRNSL